MMWKWVTRLVWAIVLAVLTLAIGGGVQARLHHPRLSAWHRIAPQRELRAADMSGSFALSDYLAREEDVFREIVERVEPAVPSTDRSATNRYVRGARSYPGRGGRNWNRTFKLVPSEVRGGALLVHGLTDAPYSMRALAETLRASGYYALALRMPGHGTVPAGLVHASWEDWMAAVRVGVRHVRHTVGPDKPLVLVGYSNGGALVTKYALDQLEGAGDPPPSRLVLVSPMIGVTRLTALARYTSLLGPIPGFEAARWLDVVHEYNPYKYNSFPANAALQTGRLTAVLQRQVLAARKAGRLGRLPPILTFQSIVDATVSTEAVVTALYDQLSDNGSELVLFDINRFSGLEPFIRPAEATLLTRLFDRSSRRYRRVLISNESTSLDAVERSVAAGTLEIVTRPIGLAWPRDVFSLSHVALPFPPDDPVYGGEVPPDRSGGPTLGQLSPRGERAVLTVPVDVLMRVSWNPFFDYMAGRVRETVEGTASQRLALDHPHKRGAGEDSPLSIGVASQRTEADGLSADPSRP